MEKKETRVSLVMPPSELQALDDWRAKHKVWSRSEAIREAVRQMVKQKP